MTAPALRLVPPPDTEPSPSERQYEELLERYLCDEDDDGPYRCPSFPEDAA